MASRFAHRPVLLDETLNLLELHPAAKVIDGTVGGGGHAEAILSQLGDSGRLIGLDVDAEALAAAGEALSRFGDRVSLVRASFRNLDSVLDQLQVPAVDAVLLDLGVSSPQIDHEARGFRFDPNTADETPLDMRMDDRLDTSAADVLADADVEELARIFREYGELPGSGRLARRIVERRDDAPLRTARDLLEVIRSAGVGRGRRHNPATLVFQALRIHVNDELAALEQGLEAAIEALRPGGRLAVISYHSLEDRRVKHGLRRAAKGCECPPHVPVCICGGVVRLRVVTRRPVRAGDDEIAANPRARSALLRVAERVAAPETDDAREGRH